MYETPSDKHHNVANLVSKPDSPNPLDSMKSTWRTGDRRKWNRHQWAMEVLALHPTDLNQPIPVHQKTDKIQYLPHYQMHIWVLVHALWPMALQQLWCEIYGKNLHPVAAFFLYTAAFHINAVHELQMLRGLGHKYGFLDGDQHERDQIPDATISRTFHSLTSTAIFRPMMSIFLAWRSAQQPKYLSPWVLIEVGMYGIVLDFWFYWYHRCMHEFDGLWKYHRTHHLTKHPTPLLTIFADKEQELFDIAVIPFLAWVTLRAMGFPMGFYEWWICHQYIVFTELFGHSGVRLYATPPSSNTLFLRLFNAELATEDHDLHHRKGYRKSHNYGKQTLLWDRIFGTTHERIETTKDNIDVNNPAVMPYFPILDDIVFLWEKRVMKR